MENINRSAHSKWKAILLSILFLGVICFPMVNQKIGFLKEKKSPGFNYSAKPKLNVQHPDSFPAKFEKYFKENIGFTNHALTFNAKFKINWMKASPNQSKVLVGKNNWLFMAGKPLNDYRGINLLSKEEIKQFSEILHNRAVRLKEKGSTFYLAIVPNKHRVYSEYLPNNIVKADGETIFDQVVKVLKTDSLINLIDLRAPIENAKAKNILYYRTDNHWNDLAAYLGYKTIIDKISQKYPKVTTVSFDNYIIDTSRKISGGEVLQIGVDTLIKENYVTLKPNYKLRSHPGIEHNYPAPKDFAYTEDFEIAKVVDDPTLPTAVIIRDSFTDFMLQFFSENFRKTTFIFDNWEYKENRNIIDIEKPDIVLIVVIEQNIRRIIECDAF